MRLRKHFAWMIVVPVLLALLLCYVHTSIRTSSANEHQPNSTPIDTLVEQGCVIVFESDRTRVDIPDSVACRTIHDALLKLPRLTKIRLGYGGRNEDAPILDSYEWQQNAAKQAINEYRLTFPSVRFRFAPGAF